MNRRNFLTGLLATATIAVVASPLALPGYGVAPAVALDEVIARTLKNYQQVMLDNLTRPSLLYAALKSRGLLSPATREEIWGA
jgi:hypothetical protein